MKNIMSPDEAEAHALSAIRQLKAFGKPTDHIDPAAIRAAAEVEWTKYNQPATKADIAHLLEEIESLRKAIGDASRREESIGRWRSFYDGRSSSGGHAHS